MLAAPLVLDLSVALREFSVVLLLSAAVVLVAGVVLWLARAPRAVHRHVCRIDRNAARIELARTRGPVTVSIRRMDDQHVWISVDGQAEATVCDGAAPGQSPRSLA